MPLSFHCFAGSFRRALKRQLLPSAGHVGIAGAWHAMQGENSDAVNEAILGFLARHASQTVGWMGKDGAAAES